MNKKLYTSPELNVFQILPSDIICTSGGSDPSASYGSDFLNFGDGSSDDDYDDNYRT